MSNSTPTFPKLNNYNYKSWSGDIQAWLMSKELWMLVAGDEPCPDDSDKESKLKWKKRAQKAAGELFLSVDQDQKSHFHGILSDPIRIWTTLRDVHMSKMLRGAYEKVCRTILQCCLRLRRDIRQLESEVSN